MKILCLGASYTGRFLSAHFSGQHRVSFLTRRSGAQAVSSLYRRGDPIDAILDTIPPVMTGQGRPYHREVEQILQANPNLPFLHISSTSLFPQSKTASSLADLPQFDEKSPPAPDSRRGEERLLLEKKIGKLYPSAQILRSTAIYGPGRSIIEQFQAGNFARAALGNRVVSRIHVYDLCRLILLLISAAPSVAAGLVHAVDRCPAPYSELFAYLEGELQIKIPSFRYSDPPVGKIVRSLYAGQLLGRYRFPTYRQGFAALFRQSDVGNTIGGNFQAEDKRETKR